MKQKILFLFAIFSIQIAFSQSNFSNGFNDGYKKGYCHNQGIGCISPIPPIAPIPNVNENLNSYQDGYNRGFEQGLNSNKTTKTNTRERYKTSNSKFVETNDSNNNSNIELLKLIELKEKQLENSSQNSDNIAPREIKINIEEFAIINIYRPRKAMGSFLPVEVLINGEIVAKLYSGGHLEYKIYDLTPKSITIKSAGIATINLVPSKNKTYYFQTSPRFSGFTLEKIASPITENELKEKHYIQTADYTF